MRGNIGIEAVISDRRWRLTGHHPPVIALL
jgi:hypothetical protein